jgi:DNA-binding transcriptional regulator YiaG
MLKYLILITILIFTGCVNTTKQNYYVTKNFNNISKDAVLEASKKVFRLSNTQDYIIDSYRDGLKITQVDFSNTMLSTSLYVNQWDISVDQDSNATKLTLSISRAEALDLENKINIKDNELYDTFFKRIEYFLGINNRYWTRCQGKLKSYNKYGLCDDTNPIDTKKVKYPFINQSQEAYKELEKQNLELLKKSSMSISKSNQQDILDLDKDIIDLEATAKEEPKEDIENTTQQNDKAIDENDNIDEKDDFEKKLDSIINSKQ